MSGCIFWGNRQEVCLRVCVCVCVCLRVCVCVCVSLALTAIILYLRSIHRTNTNASCKVSSLASIWCYCMCLCQALCHSVNTPPSLDPSHFGVIRFLKEVIEAWPTTAVIIGLRVSLCFNSSFRGGCCRRGLGWIFPGLKSRKFPMKPPDNL